MILKVVVPGLQFRLLQERKQLLVLQTGGGALYWRDGCVATAAFSGRRK